MVGMSKTKIQKAGCFWSEISAIFHKFPSRQRLRISGWLRDGHIFLEMHILHGNIAYIAPIPTITAYF